MPNLTNEVAKLLDEKKAEDISVIDVEGKSPFFDKIILATAPNARALVALAEEVEEYLESKGEPCKKPEGTSESEWVLVDGGDFVLHLLSKEKRDELSLDELIEKGK